MNRIFFVETAAGIFLLGEDAQVVKCGAFGGKEEAIRELEALADGRLGRVSADIIRTAPRNEIIFEDPRLAAEARTALGVEASAEASPITPSKLRSNIGDYLANIGISRDDYEGLRRDIAIELTAKRVSELSSSLDVTIVQAVGLLDEIDKCTNLLISRLREWYGLHFPELWGKVQRNDRYLTLVARLTGRAEFTQQNLKGIEMPDRVAGELYALAKESAGAPLEESLPHIKSLAEGISELEKRRVEMSEFLEELMGREAPNIRAVAGASIGARLIAIAGGLLNLAKMPSSKIQVLGAEKALFRSIKTGSRPPKHGLIFQHLAIHGSAKRLRGKAARALAGKIAIAARIDAFAGEFLGDKISQDFERRMKELNKGMERSHG
jgi:nucleolar protein 56